MCYSDVSTICNNQSGFIATQYCIMNATRNPRTKNVCYNLGMVDESHRMFRKIFAQVFGIQSLQDLFRDCDTWLKKQAFVNKYYNDEKLNPSDIAEEKLLGRLYEEVTQLLQRIYSTIRLITWIPPSTSVRLFPVGVRIKEKQWVCPSISRSLLSRLVWKPPGATRSHPLLTHWSSRERSKTTDTDRVRTFTDTSRHLRKRVLPIFEDWQFRLAFRMLPADPGSEIWNICNPTLYCALSLRVEKSNQINISISIAITQLSYGWSFSRHEMKCCPPDRGGRTLHVQLCLRYGRSQRSISRFCPTCG